MGNPIPSKDAREGIVSVIIDAYHTTRMAETPAWMHILSKPFVKSAFARFEAHIRADAYEQAARVGYRVCAETRHVTLGRKVEDTIRALSDQPDSTNEGLAEGGFPFGGQSL